MINILKPIVVILFPIVVILNVFNYYAFTESFYRNELPKHNVENVQEALKVVNYLKDKDSLPAMSEKEKVHMSDVKSIIQKVSLISNLSTAIFILASLVMLVRKHSISRILALGSALTALIALSFMVLSAVSFSSIFLLFHTTIFNNDYWLLPEGSVLTTLFPGSFFLSIFTKILITTILISAFVFLLTTLQKLKTFKYKFVS